MIELTLMNGTKIVINPHWLIHFRPYKDGCRLFIPTSRTKETLLVKEPYAAVCAKLISAGAMCKNAV